MHRILPALKRISYFFIAALALFAGYRLFAGLLVSSRASQTKSFYTALVGGTPRAQFQTKAVPGSLTDTVLYAPQFTKAVSGYRSVLYLFNPNDTPARVSLKLNGSRFSVKNGSFTASDDPSTVPANGLLTVDSRSFSAVVPNINYAVEITSDMPVGGNTFMVLESAGTYESIMGYNLIPKKLAGKTTTNQKVYVDYEGTYNTGHSIMNTSSVPVRILIGISDDYSLTDAYKNEFVIPPLQSLHFYAPSHIRRKFAGTLTATVMGTENPDAVIASTYQAIRNGASAGSAKDGMSYMGVSENEAANCAYLFPVYYNYRNFITGFTIQNMSPQPLPLSSVTIGLINPSVNALMQPLGYRYYADNETLKYGYSKKHYLGTAADAGANKEFAGTISVLSTCAADSDRKIAALLNHAPLPGAGTVLYAGDSGFAPVWAGDSSYAVFPDFAGDDDAAAVNIFNPSDAPFTVYASSYDKEGKRIAQSSVVVPKQTMVVKFGTDFGLPKNTTSVVHLTTNKP